MINDEVNRYRAEMLDYFHAKQIDKVPSSSSNQYHTTSLSRTTYELEGYESNDSNFTQQISIDESPVSPETKTTSDEKSNVKSDLYDQEQSQTFFTEVQISPREPMSIPFAEAFRIPPNLRNNIVLKYILFF